MTIKKITLRGAGHLLYSDMLRSGKQANVARDFLKKTVSQLCRNSVAYYQASPVGVLGDHPLRFPERGMYSHFGAAIHTLTPAHLSEISVSRKLHGKEASSGRVDLWAYYRNCDVLVELKRCSFGWKNGVSVKTLRKSWNDVCQQASTLKKEVGEWGSKRAILVGLQVALPYSFHNPSNLRMPKRAPADMEGKSMRIRHDRKHLAEEYLNAVAQYASYKNSAKGLHALSMSAVWVPPSDMCVFETSDDRIEYNPYVAFNMHLVTTKRRTTC